MGTPNARQIQFATSVVPKKTASTVSTQETREDGGTVGVASYTDTVLDTTIGKRFGGKGVVTIAEDQALQGWISTNEPQDEIDGLEAKWDETNTHWDEVIEITSTDHTIRHDSATCNFIYVKNVGSVEARLFLDGSEPDILIPPGASVSARLNNVPATDIKVDVADGANPTKIEFVVAKAKA
tara:strand:- start:2748 stop:3293 length:546 start_codon:yes stop_codon:yes gene_type:complete